MPGSVRGSAGSAGTGTRRALLTRLQDGLDGSRGSRLRIFDDSTDSVGIVAFTVAGHDPGLSPPTSPPSTGSASGTGGSAPIPCSSRLGCAGGAVRASVGGGTTTEHVDRLLEGLLAILADGPRHAYHLVDGRWAPREDDRPWPEHLTGGPVSRPAGGCAPAS